MKAAHLKGITAVSHEWRDSLGGVVKKNVCMNVERVPED